MRKTDMRSETTMAFGLQATLSGATSAAGNIVDVADFGAATFLLQTSTVTDAGAAPAGFTVKLQHSDTTAGADFEDVAAGDLIGAALAVTSDDDDNKAIGSIGYIGSRRYVRAVATGTSGTNAIVAGTWALQKPRYAPKGNVAAPISAT